MQTDDSICKWSSVGKLQIQNTSKIPKRKKDLSVQYTAACCNEICNVAQVSAVNPPKLRHSPINVFISFRSAEKEKDSSKDLLQRSNWPEAFLEMSNTTAEQSISRFLSSNA